jgi:hypothetical protein
MALKLAPSHRVADRLHVRLEQPAGVRIGDHHRRDVGAQPRLQGVEVDPPGLVRRDILHAIARERRRCRIRAVSALGDQHHLARIAAGVERRANAQQPAQLAVRARFGAHRHPVHAGQVEQPEGERVDHLQRPLHRFLRLQRVDVGEAGQPRDLLVEARVVLHRAAAEREQAEVDRIILPRQPRVMAHRFRLGQAGKANVAIALKTAEALGRNAHFGDVDASPVEMAALEQQRFLELKGAISGHGLRASGVCADRSGRPPA